MSNEFEYNPQVVVKLEDAPTVQIAEKDLKSHLDKYPYIDKISVISHTSSNCRTIAAYKAVLLDFE